MMSAGHLLSLITRDGAMRAPPTRCRRRAMPLPFMKMRRKRFDMRSALLLFEFRDAEFRFTLFPLVYCRHAIFDIDALRATLRRHYFIIVVILPYACLLRCHFISCHWFAHPSSPPSSHNTINATPSLLDAHISLAFCAEFHFIATSFHIADAIHVNNTHINTFHATLFSFIIEQPLLHFMMLSLHQHIIWLLILSATAMIDVIISHIVYYADTPLRTRRLPPPRRAVAFEMARYFLISLRHCFSMLFNIATGLLHATLFFRHCHYFSPSLSITPTPYWTYASGDYYFISPSARCVYEPWQRHAETYTASPTRRCFVYEAPHISHAHAEPPPRHIMPRAVYAHATIFSFAAILVAHHAWPHHHYYARRHAMSYCRAPCRFISLSPAAPFERWY